MIKLTQSQKDLIDKLNHPIYTVDYIEEWVNRNDPININAPAALAAMGAKGFFDAVKCFEKLHEKDVK